MAHGIKDVAKLAGISVATVSHVINGTRFVSDETKARVYDAMEKLHYTPNSVARSLRTRDSKTVALLVSDIANPFFAALIEAVETHLGRHGYNLFLCNSHEEPELERRHLADMGAQKVRGVILAPTRADFNYRSFFEDGDKYPLVMVDRRTDELQADTVVVDGVSAMASAVDALVERGYSTIAYIGGQTNISTQSERIQGYKKALKRNGIKHHSDLVFLGRPVAENGYALTERLLERGRADAVVVANNRMVVGTLQCLADRRIHIPSSMAVIGFDDYEWATITSPPLTTIRQPAHDLGLKAAEQLLQRIQTPEGAWNLHELKAELIVRSSI